MSIKLMTFVWDLELPQGRKLVLLSLADQANDAGEAFPSLEKLQQRCGMSRRTLFECLRDLENGGLITRIAVGQPGRQRVIFQINEEALRQADLLASTPGAKSAPVQKPHRCGNGTGANPRKEPVRNPHPIKQPFNSNPEAYISGASGHADAEGTFEGHADGTVPESPIATAAGSIAAEFIRRGYRITSSHPDLLAAIAEGVTLKRLVGFADLYPADHPKCRGSPGYVISAARRQLAETVEPMTPGAPNDRARTPTQPRRGAAVDRVFAAIADAQSGRDDTLDAEGFRRTG